MEPSSAFAERLATVSTHFDLRALSDRELVALFANTNRFFFGLLAAFEARGVDTGVLLDRMKEQAEQHGLNDPDCDRPFALPSDKTGS